MALFKDGLMNSIADLQNYDGAILDVATVEKIDLTAKMNLAQESIGDELLTFLLRNLARDRRAETRRFIGLADVVVTGPLRRWHASKSLAMAYGDAYGHQLNDRYEAKRQEFQGSAQLATEQYLDLGVGLVLDPIPKASAPAISTTTGNGNPFRCYIAICWLNASGHEGAPSDVSMIDSSAGANVSITAPTPPRNLTTWNIYLGTAPGALTRQNTSPVSSGSSWQMVAPNLVQGAALKAGQTPEWFLFNDRVLSRG